MTGLYFILQLSLIFSLSIIVYLMYDKWIDLRDHRRLRRNELEELREIVTRSTPMKDDELREVYEEDAEALAIIAAAKKVYVPTSMCVSQDLPDEDNKVFEMDRREQMARYLETKRALRRGEIGELDAKIVNFDKRG